MNGYISRCMLAVALAGVLGVGPVAAADGGFLKTAISSIPPRYFADIALDERKFMLTETVLSGGDERIDFDRGWVHWFYDNSRAKPKSTSMLYVKLLPRDGKTPLVLVHMPKPFAGQGKPAKNQTYVLERDGDAWRDVTETTIPKEAGLELHFRTRKGEDVVEVAEYVLFQRQDGLGAAYKFGDRKLDLVWNGSVFQVRKPESAVLSR